ncbi:hypothetical protein, conserved in T. vivax [Trypanosoma vivax Y486]|uniref:Uncharacterized protein n=1 Tax=Trypanosoma vivax (strain Y486) TaxID=1055687 RepID=F9WP61_TRYVY|nr:hypothetical protein, conserved in T. vivax [Trypanosoma vivax Y486]|eukprot:CCD19335.1 hypothetical protein, conserved in T. vivax [Trypanosoma vivax Y486]
MAVAATMAAEEAATIGGAAMAWGKTAAEVAAATGNTTVLDHVPAPWEVAEKVENVRREATHITAEASTQAQRVKDFIQLFAQYSGGDGTSTNARLCIGKTTGSAGSDTMSGTMDGAEYIYGRLGCTRSPENINASARRLLNDATLQALDEKGTPFAVRKHTGRPTGSADIYTVDGGSGRRRLEGVPAHRHARSEQQETSRCHRINDKQGQAGRLGRNLANDTSGRQHEQRQRQRRRCCHFIFDDTRRPGPTEHTGRPHGAHARSPEGADEIVHRKLEKHAPDRWPGQKHMHKTGNARHGNTQAGIRKTAKAHRNKHR